MEETEEYCQALKDHHEKLARAQACAIHSEKGYLLFCYKVAVFNQCETFTYRPSKQLSDACKREFVSLLMKRFKDNVFGVKYKSDFERDYMHDPGVCVRLIEPVLCTMYVIRIK